MSEHKKEMVENNTKYGDFFFTIFILFLAFWKAIDLSSMLGILIREYIFNM